MNLHLLFKVNEAFKGMKRFFKLSVYIIVLALLSCENSEIELYQSNDEIIAVNYGTSFGERLGYCYHNIKITETEIEYNATGWLQNDKIPNITISQQIDEADWLRIINEINFIIFRNLDEVIGCPDCADGGAEWVEIITNNLSHKVTFEYQNEPDQLKELVNTFILLLY